MIPVTLQWIGAKQFEASNSENAKFILDIKSKSGGSGLYASPTDHLLAALGACSGIDVVNILKKMRMEPKTFSIQVLGEQVETTPKYFKSIKLTYVFTGEYLVRAKIEQAVHLS